MVSMVWDALLVVAGWTISLTSGAELVACPTGTVEKSVTSSGDLHSLTDTMNCSGQGVFNVTLHSSVQLRKRIEVSDEKTVHIAGSGLPTIRAAVQGNNTPSADTDTGETTGIFLVSNGSTLNISALVLEGGFSEYGGAVTVLSSSSLHAFDCVFRDNSAATGGNEIFGRRSERQTTIMEFQITGTTKPRCLSRVLE